MPAYGGALSPPETTALVRFLETLHPADQTPAADASRRVVGQGGVPPNSTVQRGGGQTTVH
jgi:ubiquinol-cytochrome c reductase cytochrome b subunit